jgi:putative transposase
VADCLSLLLDVASRRDLATHARPVTGRCAGGHGQTSATQRGDHRQPIGQDDRKRGIRGFDAHKQVKGRKRHLLVDTLGLLLTVVVTAASVQDRDGAKPLLEVLRHQFSRLRLIWADQACAGDLLAWVWRLRPRRKICLEIVKRPKGVKGFQVLPWRWIVERTFGWLGRYRRLSKDYEYLTKTSEAMIRVAMIHLMVRRLARMTCF